jgi:hypothetical protein
MAKKRKRRPPRAAEAQAAATGRGGANVARRERKEEARQAREAELRRARRSSALRRTVTASAIAAAAVAAITLFRAASPNPIPEAALRAADAAGCTEVEQPSGSAPGGQHLRSGQSYDYPDTPATSGFHDPAPLPDDPKVYDTQPPETRAVHSLEHGAVFVYYLPEAGGGVAQAIVDRLAEVANQDRATYLAPYPDLTPEGALTLTAWNRRQSCPAGGGLTPQAAATIVNGFVDAFECTSNAPEGSNPPC